MDLDFFTKSDGLHMYEKERGERYYFFYKIVLGLFLQSSEVCDFCCFCNHSLRTVATYVYSAAYIVVGDNSCRYWQHYCRPYACRVTGKNMCRYLQFIIRLNGQQNMRKTLNHKVAGDRIYRQNWNKLSPNSLPTWRRIVFREIWSLYWEMETLYRHKPLSWTFGYTWHKRFKDD